MRPNIWLILVLLLAAILRLWNLNSFPAGFTPDEASFGYDAYSILKTGRDQWGESFPLTFRSFGDFKAPLYTYLTIPFVAIFGLNEFAVRVPNAILGTLAVLATYLLVAKLFSKGITGSTSTTSATSLALLAALLLAISPWHISLSRGAFEANLTTFLMPLGVYAFLRGLNSQRWMVVSAFAFGLNLFSYHSARIITPLIIVVLLILSKKHQYSNLKTLMIYIIKVKLGFLLIFGLFLFISVLSLATGSGARGADVGIFNPTGGWGALADRRYEAVQSGLPDVVSRLFSNKIVYTGSEFVKSYVSYLSPTFFFTQGAGEATYGMIPGHGVLYLFELPFVFAAIWMAVKKPSAAILFVIAWILFSPIPAALTKGPGFAANRAAVMMPAVQILSAYGALLLLEKFKSRKMWLGLYGGLGVLGVLFFIEAYFFHGPRVNAPSMSYGWREAMGEIREIGDKYEEIVVSRALSEPHIFVAFYKKWDPVDYQKESQDWRRYQEQKLLFVDQLGEWRLGKYTFRDIKFDDDSSLDGKLLIGRAKDFPENVVFDKRVLYPDGKQAILIVDPTKQKYAKAN